MTFLVSKLIGISCVHVSLPFCLGHFELSLYCCQNLSCMKFKKLKPQKIDRLRSSCGTKLLQICPLSLEFGQLNNENFACFVLVFQKLVPCFYQ